MPLRAYASSGDQSTVHKHHPGYFLAALLACCGILGTTNMYHQHTARPDDPMMISMISYVAECAPKKDRSTPMEYGEFTKKLKLEIEKVRGRLNRVDSPRLSIGIDDNTHQISIDTRQKIDVISLLLYWSQVLGADVDVTTNSTLGVTNHALVGGDKKSSLLLSTSRSKSSASLFKEGGFSLNDLDYILMGYEKALTSAAAGLGPDNDHGHNSHKGNDPNNPMFRIFSGRPDGSGGGYEFIPIEGLDGEQLGPYMGGGPRGGNSRAQDPVAMLRSLGVEVYDKASGVMEGSNDDTETVLTWDHLAGYSQVKEMIEDTVVLSVLHPDIYDDIVRKTRMTYESNRPKAVLLEGPPGTGKTLTARILAQRCDRPLIHLRLESIVDKYFGESEKKLTKVFDACDMLEGAVIFIDEVDALASSRDRGEMHEATRRLLSIVLQRIEGFRGKGKSLLLCATNRKQDLDAALISRFDLCIKYDLPDFDTRKAIFARYAKQFGTPASNDKAASSSNNKGNSAEEAMSPLEKLAAASNGLSCRDIKEACENAERRWASKRVKTGQVLPNTQQHAQQVGGGIFSAIGRGKSSSNALPDVPTLEIYMDCLRQRVDSAIPGADRRYSA
jgi:hypothetical protein